MKKISLYLDSKTIKELQRLSKITNVPQARILRSYVMLGLDSARIVTKPGHKGIALSEWPPSPAQQRTMTPAQQRKWALIQRKKAELAKAHAAVDEAWAQIGGRPKPD